MSPWWLLLIVPFSFGLGFLAAIWMADASCQDCRDGQRYYQAMAEAQAFESGFNKGLAKIQEVG